MKEPLPDPPALAFYPPRARWHTRLSHRAGQALRHAWRRAMGVKTGDQPGALSFRQILVSLLIPGFSFLVLGHRLLGSLFFAAYAVAGILFLVELGFQAGSIAYGLVISIHAMSIVFLEGLWFRERSLGPRLAMALLTLVAVWGLVYAPLTRVAEERWVLPVRLGDRVLIVQRRVPPKTLQRGDWVAYQFPHHLSPDHDQAVVLESGLGVDPVVALPGDRVRFTRQTVFVNGQPHPTRPHMPGEGEFVVPEKVWFIWPTLGIHKQGAVADGTVSAALQQLAMVHQNQIIGKPFERWCGRRQWP